MILDDAYAKRKHCNIIVTQPRRIAAKSLAQRVCDERDWELGTVVGYQVNTMKKKNAFFSCFMRNIYWHFQFATKNNPFGALEQIGLDRRFISEDTAIAFCTTGVLLERLLNTKTLNQYTHIILDEVHERDKDMDFLFIIIRMLMANADAVGTKIILMSATIQTEKVS